MGNKSITKEKDLKKENILKEERELFQSYLGMFRKLCNLSGEVFGLKVATITKQSISKYEAADNNKDCINIMLYIAIRHFLDFQIEKKQAAEFKEEQECELSIVLRLFDSYFITSDDNDREKINNALKLISDKITEPRNKKTEDYRKQKEIIRRTLDSLTILDEMKFILNEYKKGEWYYRYQEEVEQLISPINKSKDNKDTDKKAIHRLLSLKKKHPGDTTIDEWLNEYPEKLINEVKAEIKQETDAANQEIQNAADYKKAFENMFPD